MPGTNRDPYTGNKTRVVLSFANADGGDSLAHWLRLELNRELNYFSPDAVYLDNVASRREGGMHHAGGVNPFAMADANAGTSIIGPDTRNRNLTPSAIGISSDQNKKYLTIGATHSDWLKTWMKALYEAKVIIQIQTKGYFSSSACASEVARIALAVMDGKNKALKVLALGISPDVAKAVINNVRLPNMTPMQVQTRAPMNGPFAQLNGAVALSTGSLSCIVDFLRKAGC